MKKPCARLILFLSLLFVMTQVAYSQTVSINNVSSNIGSGRYKWTAYIEGDKSVLSKINYVEYHLPDVYGDKAVRKVSAPRAGKYPFSLTDSAFEPFSIGVMIFFKDSNPLKLPDYTLVFSGSIQNLSQKPEIASRQSLRDPNRGRTTPPGTATHTFLDIVKS
jgi:hypothetical protein